VGLTAGVLEVELLGVPCCTAEEVGVAVALGLSIGKANVPDGDGEGIGDGLGVGVGVRDGGIMFSQWYNGTVAPPISSTNFWQCAWILSKSGGPNGTSAVPGKIK
jgi:hypothetical protein